jgi:hypothetical protein
MRAGSVVACVWTDSPRPLLRIFFFAARTSEPDVFSVKESNWEEKTRGRRGQGTREQGEEAQRRRERENSTGEERCEEKREGWGEERGSAEEVTQEKRRHKREGGRENEEMEEDRYSCGGLWLVQVQSGPANPHS